LDIEKDLFGIDAQKNRIYLYTIKNDNAMQLKVSQYGGIITSIILPLKAGLLDIVLGFDDFRDYLKNPAYFGALIGRYANRISQGSFTIEGKKYRLSLNDGQNHLHGGKRGFDKVLWKSQSFRNENEAGVRLTRLSPDGEEGYPGSLRVTVDYALTNTNQIKISYLALSDQPTPVNLSNHSYFNLNGGGEGTILEHQLSIPADKYTVPGPESIPSGEIREINDTPLDFRTPRQIGERIDQLEGGYDHNFIFNKYFGLLAPAATLYSAMTDVTMEIHTTKPGMQLYSGNFLDGTLIGKKGAKYSRHAGLCLEDQHFPDSPNHSHFPPTILNPGTLYSHLTVYKFTF
jgi:aldose 1-epimerase